MGRTKHAPIIHSRWTQSGRLYQLRRGLYAIAPPYQKVKPHPFLVANHLLKASYVSLQSALAFYGLIPDTIQRILSVGAGRPVRFETQMGTYEYRHVKTEVLRGYRMMDLHGQQALVATPEKAILDLVYLQTGGDSKEFIEELRLQNMELLNLDALRLQVEGFHMPKMRRVVDVILNLARAEPMEYQDLPQIA